MKTGHEEKKTLILLMLLAFGAFLQGEFPRLDVTLRPVLLPPYPESALRTRSQARIETSLAFRDGEPVAARIVSSDFESEAADSGLSPDEKRLARELIRQSLEKSLLDTLRQWRSLLRKNNEVAVLVEYRLDSTLGPDDRLYLVHHGADGVVERIVVKGPLLNRPAR